MIFHSPLDAVDFSQDADPAVTRYLAQASGFAARSLGARPGSLTGWFNRQAWHGTAITFESARTTTTAQVARVTEPCSLSGAGEPGRRGSVGGVIDPDYGWRTERLALEPLQPGSAAELFPVLDDAALHRFTGGAPLPLTELEAWFARLAARRSVDGSQVWGNWLVRLNEGGAAVGTLQATLPAGGPSEGAAEVAWVVGRAWQGRGLATESARSLVELLRADGWTIVAHVHPEHEASQGVARAAGLVPTDVMVDGEVEWRSA